METLTEIAKWIVRLAVALAIFLLTALAKGKE
jgi:hypothetical protein